jgi:hypothetical protein
MSLPTPVKSYNITYVDSNTYKLEHEDKPFLWATTVRGRFKDTQVRLSTTSENGPIVATAMLEGKGFRVLMGGSPDTTPKKLWTVVNRNSFFLGGVEYTWRTHPETIRVLKSTLGITYRSKKYEHDFRLMGSHGGVVAVHPSGSRVDFLKEPGAELELFSLVVLMGLYQKWSDRERKAMSSSSGSYDGGYPDYGGGGGSAADGGGFAGAGGDGGG